MHDIVQHVIGTRLLGLLRVWICPCYTNTRLELDCHNDDKVLYINVAWTPLDVFPVIGIQYRAMDTSIVQRAMYNTGIIMPFSQAL
jgi:hypothetical protein